ncbi:MAG: PorP/SprF family type IX secretion system membrane protein [Bacteroidota bacterium]|nr:MAG: PorP/SprF family type IX secretion system membrane protein [Bacteroidota bacterium]
MNFTQKIRGQFLWSNSFPLKTLFMSLFISGFVCGNIGCQEVPRFSQYMMNEFTINPAVAGDDGMSTFTAMARNEWFNLGNEMRTPRNFCASAQTRILKSKTQVVKGRSQNRIKSGSNGRLGFGGVVFADNSGALSTLTGQLAYAYHIPMQASQLSFGLSGTISQISYNAAYLDFYDNTNEPMLVVANSPTYIPDFNAGINFMNSHYHLGLSVQQILQSPVMFGNSEINYKSTDLGFRRSWNLLGAAYLSLESNRNWQIEPSFWLKMHDFIRIGGDKKSPAAQLDLSLKMFYESRIWAGLSYRTVSDIVLMGGFRINKIYFSYAFDYGFNELSAATYGSHEISFSVKTGDQARRYRWMERY